MTHLSRSIFLGCSVLALAACGADDVVAPGGNIVTPTPTPGPAPTPAPTPGSVTAAASITAISSFFQQVNYIGAFSGPNDLWTEGWTCNSDVADLRGANACTDIRVS